jgi:hypothetical protein
MLAGDSIRIPLDVMDKPGEEVHAMFERMLTYFRR